LLGSPPWRSDRSFPIGAPPWSCRPAPLRAAPRRGAWLHRRADRRAGRGQARDLLRMHGARRRAAGRGDDGAHHGRRPRPAGARIVTTLLLRRASFSRPSGQWQDDDFDVMTASAMSGASIGSTPPPNRGGGACRLCSPAARTTAQPRPVRRRCPPFEKNTSVGRGRNKMAPSEMTSHRRQTSAAG
jgi:hypothetical protein